MAIYQLTVKTGSRSGWQSAAAHSDYIEREGKYARGEDDDVVHRESGHMPEWAQDDPRAYWAAADAHERANGRLYRDIEFALPKELSERQQVALAREFSASVTTGTGERLPYTLAVHHGEGENPHAHLMFSERANDGLARRAEQWFRRHNPKAPDHGGAKKSEATKPKAWLEQTRASWAEQANRALARAGCPEQIHAGSLAQQLTEAEHRGDADAIARLAHREPGVHLGPHNLARVERGARRATATRWPFRCLLAATYRIVATSRDSHRSAGVARQIGWPGVCYSPSCYHFPRVAASPRPPCGPRTTAVRFLSTSPTCLYCP